MQEKEPVRVLVKANFIYNLIYNIVNIIVPLVTAPYTARVLGAENIGIYSYTYAIVSSVVMFGALGTATYGQKEIASAGENIVERSEKFLEIWVLKAVTMVIAFLIFVPYAYQTTAWVYYASNECKYAASNRRAVFDVLKIH